MAIVGLYLSVPPSVSIKIRHSHMLSVACIYTGIGKEENESSNQTSGVQIYKSNLFCSTNYYKPI